MLQLRPICEHCAIDLPPASTKAWICSYECTFCRTCVEELLENVCPNCGGGFVPRPVRPARDWKDGNFLGADPPVREKKHRPVDPARHREFIARVGGIPPEDR